MSNSLFWLGLIPIVAFVLLDAFASKRKALFSALILGTIEFTVSLLYFGSLDIITWFTFAILFLLLGVSLKTNNDVFFKVQGPVVYTLIALFMLIAYWIFDANLLLQAFEKYIGFPKVLKLYPNLDPNKLRLFFTNMNIYLPWGLLSHSLVTCWAALQWNRWVWFFLRVPGFFFVLYVVAQLANK